MKQKNLILMVVAVGCGLVAAFLTSQMSAKGQVEQVDVLVAAKDLPVGTPFTAEDIDKHVKQVKRPKDGLPPNVVTDKNAMVGKRLSRQIRADETFDPKDLSTGGIIALPEGLNLYTMPVSPQNGGGGFVVPGDRVTILANLGDKKMNNFKLLVNVLVVGVDTSSTSPDKGTYASMNHMSFAVTQKQAQLLSLARFRHATLELLLLNPLAYRADEDRDYDIDKVLKLLSDEKHSAGLVTDGNDQKPPTNTGEKPATPGPEVKPVQPAPTVEMARVLVAKRDLAKGTEITADLIGDAFQLEERPKEYAGPAVGDLTPALGLVFPNGIKKGETVVPSMIGDKEGKVAPLEAWSPPKPGPETKIDPKQPTPGPTVVKKKYFDVKVITSSGIVVHRYETWPDGTSRKVAEMTPEQAAQHPPEDGAPKKRD